MSLFQHYLKKILSGKMSGYVREYVKEHSLYGKVTPELEEAMKKHVMKKMKEDYVKPKQGETKRE